MINQFKKFVQKKQSIWLFSNMVFSGSTYLVMVYTPFLLNVDTMAQLAIIYNAMLVLVWSFELGTSITFLRFYQIKKNVLIINSIIQFLIILTLIILGNTYLGNGLFRWLNLASLDASKEIFFFSIICQLSWIYTRNILLSQKYYLYILMLSVSILMLRILGIYLFDSKNIDIENIFITLFIVPFIPIVIIAITGIIKNIIKIPYISIRIIRIFAKQTRRFLKFSFFTYIIALLNFLSARYLMLYLSGTDNDQMIADLGYAMTFLGVITVFTISFRNYYISIFNGIDKNSINIYLDNYLKKIKMYTFFTLFICVLISIVFSWLKPEYLSVNSVIFLLISLISSFQVMLLSLITFLARTMGYNSLELKINFVKVALVWAACNSIIPTYPVFGFIIIYLVMLLAEIYLAKVVMKRLGYAY